MVWKCVLSKLLGVRVAVPSSFQLAGAALYCARQIHNDEKFKEWRKFLRRLEILRNGRIDPLADQNANLDMLLRTFESDIKKERLEKGSLKDNTAGVQLHLQLSRLWVLGTYEYLRSLHKVVKVHDHPAACCMRPSDSKGCGKLSCPCCAIGHLKNEAALVRIMLVKGGQATEVKNPPLTGGIKEKLLDEEYLGAPPVDSFLFEFEGVVDGVITWDVFDQRLERKRTISRLNLSNRVLAGLNEVPFDPELQGDSGIR